MTRELNVDTAVVCGSCHGEGAAWDAAHPIPCETCRGAGEVANVQRSFLGEIRTLRRARRAAASALSSPAPVECSGDGRVRSPRSP